MERRVFGMHVQGVDAEVIPRTEESKEGQKDRRTRTEGRKEGRKEEEVKGLRRVRRSLCKLDMMLFENEFRSRGSFSTSAFT